MEELVGETDRVDVDNDEHLAAWLAHARPAIAAFDGGAHPVALAAAAKGFDPVDQLGMVNVAVQVETLVQHPVVGPLHAAGRLKVIGLFYDLSTARVLHVRPADVDEFRPDEIDELSQAG